MYKNYCVILFLCIVISIGLIFSNYMVQKKILQAEKKQILVKEKEKSKELLSRKYGYSDIIQCLNKNPGIVVKRFNEVDGDNTVSTEIQLLCNIGDIEKTLGNIRNAENFNGINEIKIEKYENGIITTVNMAFTKNR